MRQAFAYSLDRKQIVDTIGRGVIPFEGNGGVSQTTPGYSKKAADWYSYDPAKANALLDAAGWTERDADGVRTKDGKPLTVILPYGAGSIINADGAAILQGVKEQAIEGRLRRQADPGAAERAVRGQVRDARGPRPERRVLDGRHRGHPVHQLAPEHRRTTRTTATARSTTTRRSSSTSSTATRRPTSTTQNADYQKAQDYIAEHALAIGVYDRLSTLAVVAEAEGRLAGARAGRTDVL